MNVRDHLSHIWQIAKQSGIGSISAAAAFVGSVVAFSADHWLSEEHKRQLEEIIGSAIEYWPYALFVSMAVIVWILYQRTVPRLDILFEDRAPFKIKTAEGIAVYRVDLINYGVHQDNVSFRLDHIQNEVGEYLPLPRRAFERENGKGPMPLGSSAKAAYIASMDEDDSNSSIDIRTVSPAENGYEPKPLKVKRGTYFLSTSLCPREGQPRYQTFKVFVSPDGQLRMQRISNIRSHMMKLGKRELPQISQQHTSKADR